jgi:hypothetical protein
VGPRAGLATEARGKILLPLSRIEISIAWSSVARHYTDCATRLTMKRTEECKSVTHEHLMPFSHTEKHKASRNKVQTSNESLKYSFSLARIVSTKLGSAWRSRKLPQQWRVWLQQASTVDTQGSEKGVLPGRYFCKKTVKYTFREPFIEVSV